MIKKVSEIFSKNLQTALPMIKKHARVSMIKCLQIPVIKNCKFLCFYMDNIRSSSLSPESYAACVISYRLPLSILCASALVVIFELSTSA